VSITRSAKGSRYKGYRSYQYLEAGVDYQPVALPPEVGRVPSKPVAVSAAQEERVQRLLRDCLVISLHDHTAIYPLHAADARNRFGRAVTGYEGLSISGLDAFFDTPNNFWKWDELIHGLGMRLADLAHQDFVVPARTLAEIRAAKANGQIACVFTLEAATVIENELDRLDVLYGLGIRLSGISYSMSNALGTGGREIGDGGLTAFGRQAVKRMNKLGMAVDVSHASDQTSLDTIAASSVPVFITHAGARSLWNAPRMKPDAVIVACAERGGVIGVEAAPMTTLVTDQGTQTIDTVMQHFEYVLHLVGIDHIAFGPDTSFGDHVGQLRVSHPHLFNDPRAHGGLTFEPFDYVDGIENPGEGFLNIVRWLVAHGYSDGDIAKAIGGNIARVLEEVWT